MSKRVREAPEVAAAVRRLLTALVGRAADGELEALEALASLDATMSDYLGDAVRAYRRNFTMSWDDIGKAVGTTRQAAFQRFHGAGKP